MLGLDPDPANLWPEAVARATIVETPGEDAAQLTAEAVAFVDELIVAGSPPAPEAPISHPRERVAR